MPTKDNHLLALLTSVERKRIMMRCEPIELALSEVIGEPNARARHVYFPTGAFFSLVLEVDRRPGLEVGMVGHEGMLGVELLLGNTTSPWRAVVQGSGEALRMKAAQFREALSDSPALRHLAGRYLAFRIEQLALSAACERFHEIGPRLARWMLMSHDRSQHRSFHVTHEFLAFMLGVRRVGVTVAAHELQRLGLIEYRRGEVTVLNLEALRTESCSCYESNRIAYDRLVH